MKLTYQDIIISELIEQQIQKNGLTILEAINEVCKLVGENHIHKAKRYNFKLRTLKVHSHLMKDRQNKLEPNQLNIITEIDQIVK